MLRWTKALAAPLALMALMTCGVGEALAADPIDLGLAYSSGRAWR